MRVWTVNLAMGYLNAQDRYRSNCIGLIGDSIHAGAYQELHPLLLQVLQQRVGLTFQEATSYLQGYSGDYFSRWNEPRDIQQHIAEAANQNHDTHLSE